MTPDQYPPAEGGAAVKVTLEAIYAEVRGLTVGMQELLTSDRQILAEQAKHETRLNAHDVVIGKHGERITSLEAWKSGEERSAPPRANAVTVASVVVAGLSVVVAVIAIIVGAQGA